MSEFDTFMNPLDHQLPTVGDFSKNRRWIGRAIDLGKRHIRFVSAGAAVLLVVPLSFAAVYVAHNVSISRSSHSITTKHVVKQKTGTASHSGSSTTTNAASPSATPSATNQISSPRNTPAGSTSSGSNSPASPLPQTTWAACTNGGLYKPLSDAAAASLVTHQPEIRKYNVTPYSINGVSYQPTNYYVPTDAELSHFESAVNVYGQTAAQANPYLQYVDGRDGMSNPSTDDLIQWGAHKWGIPEDWLRAEYAWESWWNQFNDQGDQTNIVQAGFSQSQFPVISWVPGSSTDVYESLGITQVRWTPDNGDGIGSEPLRWKSTAFNIDFQAATVRFYYDNPNGARSTWGDASYTPCQQWNSLGGWYNPYPWNNSGQAAYISNVQNYLSQRIWTTPSFLSFTPTVAPVVTFQ